jgi:2-phosphoglycerate kinase
MRIKVDDYDLPYPLTVLSGRMRLCGLSKEATLKVVDEIRVGRHIPTEEELYETIQEQLSGDVAENFRMMREFDEVRKDGSAAPLIVMLEGASATGKSMLMIDLIHSISATRIITTDTVRQVLRSMMSEKDNPELFCHTYQAHKYKQSGPENLTPVLRGYLAQCEHIESIILRLVQKTLHEGTDTVVEGVHVTPGVIYKTEPQVIEIVINPDEKTHRDMFLTKYSLAKLRSVSEDESTREVEYTAAREIQEYMLHKAEEKKIPIINFSDYGQCLDQIHSVILAYVRDVLNVISLF